ncbi:hypothetical protein FACS189485_07640 [Spirochaetia bacterium]|nr:hypothetical protein FACS189485_07640 [Spirochaetia bacterium]
MKVLSDKEILAVTSPRERPEGRCIRGPWLVLQKTQKDSGVEAFVLLEWQGEPDTPFVRRIGKRLFKEDGPFTGNNTDRSFFHFTDFLMMSFAVYSFISGCLGT